MWYNRLSLHFDPGSCVILEKRKTVYIAMSADIIHSGHLNIIHEGAKLGDVIVGVLTDEAIATYKRLPLLDFETRTSVIGSLKGVTATVPQETLSYADNIRRLRPDYVVHGDDWATGVQSNVRREVIDLLAEYGGRLVEIPYTSGVSTDQLEKSLGAIYNTPDVRRAKLRRMLRIKPWIRVMEASNGLSGLIVENTRIEDPVTATVREYDAMWVSSLCDSTFKGKPDIELVDLTSRINTINEIMEVTSKPIILDGDTGGKPEHFFFNVRTLERLGVSAIIIEDKTGLKQNSLFGTEMGIDDAMERAKIYLEEGGADGIMIHSREKDGSEIFEFLRRFREYSPDVPVILVPTSYNQFTEEQLHAAGANIIIYANHLLRSAYPAMAGTARKILECSRSKEVDDVCLSIKEVLSLIPNKN